MNPTLLTLITPCARPWLLPSIAASVRAVRQVSGVQLRWLVDFKLPSDPYNEANFQARLNRMIRELPAGYWNFVSDDTLLDPEIIAEWNERRLQYPEVGIFLFHQQLAPGRFHWANPTILEAGGALDNGQAIISVAAARKLDIDYTSLGWERYYFRRVAHEHGVQFIDKVLTYHQDIRVRYGQE